MNEGWSYVVTPPAQREMQRIDMSVRRRIFAALTRLTETGAGDARKLTDREGEWRLRVGDYRVIFERDAGRRLLVVLHVLPRGRAYRGG